MGKLYFYSDQIIEENMRIDFELVNGIGKKQIKLGYIPSCGDKDRRYFNKQKDYYSQYNIKDYIFFDLEDEYNEDLIKDLLTCDIIHISGGDPIYCLNNMHKRDFYKVLKQYFNNNGTIVGVSGGAVQLGKSAGLYKVFQSNADATICNLDKLQTSGLADFEFLPHYNRWDIEFKNAVKDYSIKSTTIIYACNDGDGIIVDNGSVSSIGDIIKIKNGKETNLF